LAQLVETQRGRSFSWGTLLIQLLLFWSISPSFPLCAATNGLVRI
jgi:hypothetical protein